MSRALIIFRYTYSVRPYVCSSAYVTHLSPSPSFTNIPLHLWLLVLLLWELLCYFFILPNLNLQIKSVARASFVSKNNLEKVIRAFIMLRMNYCIFMWTRALPKCSCESPDWCTQTSKWVHITILAAKFQHVFAPKCESHLFHVPCYSFRSHHQQLFKPPDCIQQINFKLKLRNDLEENNLSSRSSTSVTVNKSVHKCKKQSL